MSKSILPTIIAEVKPGTVVYVKREVGDGIFITLFDYDHISEERNCHDVKHGMVMRLRRDLECRIFGYTSSSSTWLRVAFFKWRIKWLRKYRMRRWLRSLNNAF